MSFWRSRFGKNALLTVCLSMLCATGGCKQGPWQLWSAYNTHFIDPQGRVVDPQGGNRTTSEGQSYALFFALVNNDRPTFDRVLGWTRDNLAQGDLGNHLPAWLWGKDKDGSWKIVDPNSASDADVWLAYSLYEAGGLWDNPTYTKLGVEVMGQIARTEVVNLPGFGPMLIPGPSGFQHGQVWTLNPSYLPLFIFQRFADIDPSGPWGQIALGIPSVITQSSRHGFAMDWVDYLPGDGFYPATEMHPGNQATDAPGGSYDAIRVYLWAGMVNDASHARSQLLNAIPAMSVYLANHDAPPEKVSEQGIPVEQDGPVGFSAAVLPYLRALPDLEKVTAEQLLRLEKARDPASGLYGKDPGYYDQNLALFATGYLGGRFSFGPSGQLKVEWKHS